MPSKRLIIAVGALAVIGGAAAIAATGKGDGLNGEADLRQDAGRWDEGLRFAQGGPGAGQEDEGRWHRRGRHHGEGSGRGWDERGGGHRWRGHRGGHGWGGRRGGRTMTLEGAEARARERFARFDKNGDNVLDSDEIEARISARRGRRGARMGQRMMRRFDGDKDGKVTRAEVEERLKRRFARIDLNNDGRISDEDLPPILRGRNVLSPDGQAAGRQGWRRGWRGNRRGDWRGRRSGRRMIRQVRGRDANKDGSVSFEEFSARALARFERMDRDKNGAIEQSDFDALRKEMLNYRVQRFIHRFGVEADKAKKVTREQFLENAKVRFERRQARRETRLDGDGRGHRGRGWGGRGSRDHHGGGGRRGRGERDL